VGFRGPAGSFSPFLAFDVHGGQITGLEGGVFGPADFPFFDFLGTNFSAADIESPHTVLFGELEVAQVPEPSTFLLLVPFPPHAATLTFLNSENLCNRR
jgi:hypothetical protein